jgi:geranyl-CoA carboxylase alpha subunit
MSARFDALLIANRGEIACRVIRAARAEGLRTVAVYSDADADAPHVRLADLAVRIGPAPPAQSYLSIPALIAAAKAAGAGAIHPGYGFLAENADFADAAAEAGLVFVGPPAAAIRAMGDKSAAKARMQEAGVPAAPGYHGEDQSLDRFSREAASIGYPVMVKAAAGGGGRGLRIVGEPDALPAAIAAARAEAAAAFGDGRLLIERALRGARHVEVQVFADERGAIVYLGERDCSIQRRRQKLIEESPAVSPALRRAMGETACAAAQAVGYVGAGTVEFLLDAEHRFYFLEMNTRIQVEHPVTEAVTGLDLVRLQLQVAQGRPLPFSQADVRLDGHAIEARLCAEGPDFAPATGRLVAFRAGEGARLDSGVEAGSVVTPHYDSLLAKLIAHGATREEARRKLVAALEATFVAGVATNRDYLLHALTNQTFVAGEATTSFVEEQPFAPAPPSPLAFALAASLLIARDDLSGPTAGWRAAPVRLAADGVERRLSLSRDGEDWLATSQDGVTRLRILSRGRDEARFLADGLVRRAAFAREGDALWLDCDGACRRFVDLTYAPPRREDLQADGAVTSPVNGVVVAVEVEAGQAVRRGQALGAVEAMKMQYALVAPIDGIVAEARAVAGKPTQARALLFLIAPEKA